MTTVPTISADELREKLEGGEGMVLIDVLGENSYRRAHIPGAVSVDGHGDDVVAEVAEYAPDKSAQIVVYCASPSCQLSPQVADRLAEAEYTNVADFEGGLKEWAQQGYEFEGEHAEEMQEKLAMA